ncbi:hypothetical protein SETIT_3G111300v2 [Setaria italica]|uniref:Bifunctional inhibitor/plant lipid transfer protein/seed storage helical domain-containing protein n=1 Tax=Setaria italica TaxID=4555 RepID=K3ZCE7_SETIT|nr:hypothetical protein SETIT_3G111300v2 [Setaria italica]
MAGNARVTGAYLRCCLIVILAAVSSSSCSSYIVRHLKDENMHECRHNIAKNLGSPWDVKHGGPCCEKVREVNVADICQQFMEVDKASIALWMWAVVTRKCGNGLATGSDCAGYTVPPSRRQM